MTKMKYAGIAVISLIVTVAALLVGKKLFSDNKGKALTLLKSNEKIVMSGSSERINNRVLIEKYFELHGYSPLWTNKSAGKAQNRNRLLSLLVYADSLGLNSSEYHTGYVLLYDSLVKLENFEGSETETETELIFTDAGLSFLYDVAYGKAVKRFSYEGVKCRIDTVKVLNLFHELVTSISPASILDSIEQQNLQYRKLKKVFQKFNTSLCQPDYKEVRIAEGAKGEAAALTKLKALGLLTTGSCSAGEFKSAMLEFQKMISADTTGVLDAPTREALNVPLAERMEEIKKSLNYWRWTNRVPDKEFILINIAAARLQVVSKDSLRNLSMKVIVGKEDTRTPSFTAYITQVITYPYWTVPLSIAVKEMLPKIKRRLKYLDDNNLQVINSKGQEVNPSFVAWSRLSKNYFPYTIRQSTGCDNSLGVMKFDLNSPYSIYLHDTNVPELFNRKNRHLSHGCVRLEKPKELAHFILDNGPDTVQIPRIDSCMKDQKPNEFKLKKRIPVVLLYMTADIEETGRLKFYKDVYGLEEKRK